MSGRSDQVPIVERQLLPLERATCLELLATQPVGRLVFTHRALPEVLPVNYQLDGEQILIRLAIGSTAAKVIRGSVVAFEVDHIDIGSRIGWSVTVVGHAHEVNDAPALARVEALGLESWTGDPRDHFVAIVTEKVTGRRLVAPVDEAEGRL